MKKLIVLTLVLVALVALITAVYFKSLKTPDRDIAAIIQAIPSDAGLILQFSNDGSFEDAYGDSPLLGSLIGSEQMEMFRVLNKHLLQNTLLKPYFADQDIYVSVHSGGELLLTIKSTASLPFNDFMLALRNDHDIAKVSLLKRRKMEEITINFPRLAKPFIFIGRRNQIYSGSFSKALIDSVVNDRQATNANFATVSDQQQTHALANLYLNYSRLKPLFDTWFKQKNTDVLKPARLLPGTAALTLNYKRDALMFNGYTTLQPGLPAGYLTIFKNQQPFQSRLKDIFPALTAFSTCFSVSDPIQFQHDLNVWQNKAGLQSERDMLMNRIKADSGVNISEEFHKQLGNEFGFLTTRFDEKLAIIQIRNGSQLQPVLANISTMSTGGIGQFNYPKLPFFLLGDAFSLFKQPYFAIIDNYLLLADTPAALNNYLQNYHQQQFLSKQSRYNEFDDLLAERCNVAFFVHFKNAAYLLKRDLKPACFEILHPNRIDSASYYAGALQLSSYNRQFYTSFCMQLNKADTGRLR